MAKVYFEDQILSAYHVRPGEEQPGEIYGYMVVAVIGHAGDWCAYRAPTNWSPERAASEGDAIHEKAARALFPAFSERTYRS